MTWLTKSGLVPKSFRSIDSGKLKLKDQINLFTSIRNFLNNGFALEEAIDFYTVVNSRLQRPINKLKRNLAEGKSFSASVQSLVNSRTFFQLKIAESHGDLPNALNNISKFLTLRQKQKSKLMGLLIYPLFLVFLLIGILIAIRLLVTPQLQTFNHHPQASGFLKILIGGLPILVLLYGLWRYCYDQNQIWRINTSLRIPLLGKVFRAYYAYYFASNLALMMSCGMDLKQIVNFMATFKTSSLIQDLSRDVKAVINHGHSFNQLREKYRFLPKELGLLLDAGDTDDVLSQKLKAYSKVEFKLMMKRSSRLISMVQPVMFLIIGLFIAGAYLSMLLPMYQSIKGVY